MFEYTKLDISFLDKKRTPLDHFRRFKRWVKDESLINPLLLRKEIKYFYQRGRRGWSDRDVWSIDYYLDNVIPAMIRHLKKTQHGYSFIDQALDIELNDFGSEEYRKRHEDDNKKWDAILDEIAEGFEAHKHIDECYDEKCPGYWKNFIETKTPSHPEQRAKFKRAMNLLYEHYDGLWD